MHHPRHGQEKNLPPLWCRLQFSSCLFSVGPLPLKPKPSPRHNWDLNPLRLHLHVKLQGNTEGDIGQMKVSHPSADFTKNCSCKDKYDILHFSCVERINIYSNINIPFFIFCVLFESRVSCLVWARPLYQLSLGKELLTWWFQVLSAQILGWQFTLLLVPVGPPSILWLASSNCFTNSHPNMQDISSYGGHIRPASTPCRWGRLRSDHVPTTN